MNMIWRMGVDQSPVGEPERRGDERSEAPRSGGSPTGEREVVPVPPDPEVPARQVADDSPPPTSSRSCGKPTRVRAPASSGPCCDAKGSTRRIWGPGVDSASTD